MYNSSADLNQNDGESTMIDQSFLYDRDDDPSSDSVVSHFQRAREAARNTTIFDDRHDYVYVEHDRLEAAKAIEQILNYYRQDLKHESMSQLECSQQLITRLVDFIRPAYSADRKKMGELETLFEEISTSQDIRFVEPIAKNEQLEEEIRHLRKLIITTEGEGNRQDNMMTKAYRIDSMINYEQWMVMEEEAKRLCNLVEKQRDRINELIKLISEEGQTFADTEQPAPFNPHPPTSEAQDSTEETTGTNILEKAFNSPDTSPIHSLTDFLTKSLIGTVDIASPNEERPAITTLPRSPLTRLPSYNDVTKCPVCNYEFAKMADEFERNNHVESCLASADNNSSNECPNCNRHFPDNDHVYLEHLTACLNDRLDRF